MGTSVCCTLSHNAIMDVMAGVHDLEVQRLGLGGRKVQGQRSGGHERWPHAVPQRHHRRHGKWEPAQREGVWRPGAGRGRGKEAMGLSAGCALFHNAMDVMAGVCGLGFRVRVSGGNGQEGAGAKKRWALAFAARCSTTPSWTLWQMCIA